MTAADLIDSFESCVLTAYWDAIGKRWTIGWGHTGKDVYDGLVWTQAQADDSRDHDIIAADALISIYSPGLTGGPLEAITDFVFNLGIGNYRTSTLCKPVNANNWAAIKPELLKWDHDKVIEGRATVVNRLRQRWRPDQGVQITALEFMRVASEHGHVGDSIVVGASLEHVTRA